MQNPYFTKIAVLSTAVLLLASIAMPTSPSRRPTEQITTVPGRSAASNIPARWSSEPGILQRYLQDQFGMAPSSISPLKDYATAREFLATNIEMSGHALRQLTLDEFVTLGLTRESHPALIGGANGSMAVVTDVVTDDHDQPFLQILEGDNASILVTPQRLRDTGFNEIWTAESDSLETEIRIGQATATIDRVLLPVGLVRPSLEVKSQFVITNTGDQPLLIGRIEPTCGCTSVKPHEELELAAGQSQKFHVGVAAGDSGSCVQHVDLTIFSRGSGDSQELRVTVCGNVLESFQISPTSLSFGDANSYGAEPIVRRIRLTQPDSDPYEIISAVSDGAPLNLTWEQVASGDSSQLEYLLTAVLDPRQLKPGRHRGEIMLTTNSARRPRAQIPFDCTVRGAIRAVPEVAAFGMVQPGQSAAEQIAIRSRHGALQTTTVASCPPWISCEVSPHHDAVHLVLTASTDQVDYHFGRLRLHLTTDSGSEELVIPCSLSVHQARGSNP